MVVHLVRQYVGLTWNLGVPWLVGRYILKDVHRSYLELALIAVLLGVLHVAQVL